jgi:CRP-like cAMP-binding protein
LIAVEAYALRVRDFAERLRINPGSASRVLARAAERERGDRRFHQRRLELEKRLAAEFERSRTGSRR